MRILGTRPPSPHGTADEKINDLYVWLCLFADELSLVLSENAERRKNGDTPDGRNGRE